MSRPPRIVVYIAASLDGRIAAADGSVDWLQPFETHDYGFDFFISTIDALVMGRSTFEQVLGFGAWPYEELPTIVLSSRPLPPSVPKGVERAASVTAARERLAALGARRVWNVGGGRTIGAFMAADAVDELHLFLIPTLVGAGRPLADVTAARRLKLLEFQSHGNGVMELRYGVVPAERVATAPRAAAAR